MSVKLKEFKFGYADADTELRREPQLFDKAFYDPKRIVSEALNGYKFLILGRKGTGKSAIGAKIRRLASSNDELIAERIHLSDFEFRTFAKLSNASLSGGARYAAPWKLMLMLQAFATVGKVHHLEQLETYSEIATTLQNYGILPNDNLSRVVREVSRKSFKISLPFNFGVEFAGGDKEVELNSPEEIVDVLFRVLKELYIEPYQIRIIIDGLDDALRGKQRQLDIVSGLVRAADSLNNSFVDIDCPIKFIILARTDVLALCNDPDLNKIKRDSAIQINWYQDVQNPLNSDLMGLLDLRFKTSCETVSTEEIWYKIFPTKIRYKDSWHYILEHTIHRPRDILQFMIECQRLYPENDSLSFSEITSVLSSYSENYFLEEMKNEIAGFVSDGAINSLPSILSNLGLRFEFSRWCKVFTDDSALSNEDPRRVVEILFDNGYIGQVRKGTNFIVFKFRDSHEKINFQDLFIIHRGLLKALNLA